MLTISIIILAVLGTAGLLLKVIKSNNEKICILFFKDHKHEIEEVLTDYHSYELDDISEVKKTILSYLKAKDTETSIEILSIIENESNEFLVNVCKFSNIILH